MVSIRTFVVEDEPLIAEAPCAVVDRVAGYTCIGAVHDGGSALQRLLKPFTFAAFRDKLERYADYRAATLSALPAARGDIDRALASLRGSEAGALPKGLAPDSLELVVRCLQGADEALSAQDVESRVGMSRVTARRYLEHLADGGPAGRRPRYGGGRPEHVYRWAVRD